MIFVGTEKGFLWPKQCGQLLDSKSNHSRSSRLREHWRDLGQLSGLSPNLLFCAKAVEDKQRERPLPPLPKVSKLGDLDFTYCVNTCWMNLRIMYHQLNFQIILLAHPDLGQHHCGRWCWTSREVSLLSFQHGVLIFNIFRTSLRFLLYLSRVSSRVFKKKNWHQSSKCERCTCCSPAGYCSPWLC